MCKYSIGGQEMDTLRSWRGDVQKKLGDERKALIHIFQNVDIPMYVATMDTHIILLTNHALEKLVGANVVGKKCHEVLQGRTLPCDFCTNEELKKAGDVYVWEFFHDRGRWYRCIDTAIPWHDGSLVRFEMAIDITDMKVIENNLRTAMSIVADGM